MSDFDDFMRDLEEASPLENARTTRQTREQVQHKCQKCEGTGQFRGRGYTGKCFECNGKGWFKRSAEDRQKSREAAKRRKAATLADKQAAFNESNPGIVDFLRANGWSSFFISMLQAYEKYGSLTDNQVRAINSSQAKIAARRIEREERREAAKVIVDLSTIVEMFNKARQSGLKRTKYHAEGLTLQPAGEQSRNAGAIYVHRGVEYIGKVVNGQFMPTWTAHDDDKKALLIIADNPKEAAVNWGKRTGRCSCCGRELTDPDSIAAGIGPICASKWF